MRWKAVYGNGTFLNQFNSDGSENKYTDIQREKLVQFQVLNNGKVLVAVHLDPNKKLIYRQRVAMHFALGPKGKTGEERVWLVGWQENRRGVNVQMLCAVFPDGHVEIVDRFRENHPWFNSVRFLPIERL